MERIITIDGKEILMKANGATPLIYRNLFERDIFEDMRNAIDGKRLKDPSVIDRLAYVMARQGGSCETNVSLEDWLGTIDDPLGLVLAAEEIVGIWTGNQKTLSVPKKKIDQ